MEVWPRDVPWTATTDRRPFGELFEISPPHGQDDNAEAYAEGRPAVAKMVLAALAEWWQEAAGVTFAIPALGKVEGDPLRVFDLHAREWRTDQTAVKAAERTSELRARLQPLLPDRLGREIAAVLRDKLAKITQREDCLPQVPMFTQSTGQSPSAMSICRSSTRCGWFMSRTAIVARPPLVRPIIKAPCHAKWRFHDWSRG